MARKSKTVEQTVSILDAASQCANEVQQLAEEMREWESNMSERLSHTDKYSQVEEAANELENADLENALSSLEEAMEAVGGSPAVAGCPEHEIGKPCTVCGWNGKVPTAGPQPRLEIFNPPTKTEYQGRPITVVAQVSYQVAGIPAVRMWVQEWGFSRIQGTGRVETGTVADARQFLIKRTARWSELHAGKGIPKRREGTPEISPIEGLEDLDKVKVTFYEEGGKRLSRATRLANALAAGNAAIEELQERLREYQEKHKDDPVTDDDEEADKRAELVDELDSAVDEFSSSLSNLDGVEFPGMY